MFIVENLENVKLRNEKIVLKLYSLNIISVNILMYSL